MLKHLKNIFLTILICLLSAMVTPNILKYIWISLKFSPLLRIYRQLFNRPNLTYILNEIHKTGFKDLDFLILSESIIGKIQKTTIFVDKIDNIYSRLSKHIQRKKRPNHIIPTFMANLTTILRTWLLADLYLGKTQI